MPDRGEKPPFALVAAVRHRRPVQGVMIVLVVASAALTVTSGTWIFAVVPIALAVQVVLWELNVDKLRGQLDEYDA